MNPVATALVASAAKTAIAYVRADQTRKYGLIRRAVVYIDGPGVGKYHYQDDVLGIISPHEGSCILAAEPFPSSSDNWNGPDMLPDTLKDGSFEMSLWHDLVVKRAKEIAKANHTSEQDVFAWANGLVPALMDLYAEKKPKGWWKRLVYNTLEIARPVYHPIKKLVKPLFGCAAFAAACGFSGCDSPPDWHAHGGDEAAIVWELDGGIHTNAPNYPRSVLSSATAEFVTNAEQRAEW